MRNLFPWRIVHRRIPETRLFAIKTVEKYRQEIEHLDNVLSKVVLAYSAKDTDHARFLATLETVLTNYAHGTLFDTQIDTAAQRWREREARRTAEHDS